MFVDQIPLALQILEITDPDDVAAIRMVAANRVACENVDATLEELVHEWPRRYAVVDSQPGNLEAFAEVRRTGTSLTKHERSWIDRDGRDRRRRDGQRARRPRGDSGLLGRHTPDN